MTAASPEPQQASVPAHIELGPNPFLQYGLPTFVASLGLLMCLVLMFLPAKDNILKIAGLMVLFTDAGTAFFLSRIFGSQSVTAGGEGVTLRNFFGEKTIPWNEIASFDRVAHKGDIQFRVYDAEGRQSGRWSGYLGTREGRDALTDLLRQKTGLHTS